MNIYSKSLLLQNKITYSEWSGYTLPQYAYSCAYIPFLGLYIITMYGGYYAKSYDLVDFYTYQIANITDAWTGVACDGDTVIFCSSGGKIAITQDLVNFTIKTVNNTWWNSIVYGNNTFVVCGHSNNLIPCISYTTDKSNFSPIVQVGNRTGYGVYGLDSIAFGNNVFFAKPNDGEYCYFANYDNLENWTQTVYSSVSAGGTQVRYLPANGLFNLPCKSGSMTGILQNSGRMFWGDFKSISGNDFLFDIAYLDKYYVVGKNTDNDGIILSGTFLDDRHMSVEYNSGSVSPKIIATGPKGILVLDKQNNVLIKRIV